MRAHKAIEAFQLIGPFPQQISCPADLHAASLRFREGEHDTGFIAEEYPEGLQGAPANEARARRPAAMNRNQWTARRPAPR